MGIVSLCPLMSSQWGQLARTAPLWLRLTVGRDKSEREEVIRTEL
jgi:hypothetical protein